MAPRIRDPFERFTEKFLIDDGCWEWLSYKSPTGYGKFISKRWSGQLAHRFIWEFFNGPIPEGFEIHHVCGNRGCVNLGHLRVVTHAENMSHRVYERANRCINGHEFTEANTRINKRGWRCCRACDAIRKRRRRRLLSV